MAALEQEVLERLSWPCRPAALELLGSLLFPRLAATALFFAMVLPGFAMVLLGFALVLPGFSWFLRLFFLLLLRSRLALRVLARVLWPCRTPSPGVVFLLLQATRLSSYVAFFFLVPRETLALSLKLLVRGLLLRRPFSLGSVRALPLF